MNPSFSLIRRLLLAAGLTLASLGAQAGAYDDLIAAVYRDDSDTVIAFVERGMDVNSVDPAGNTLLHVAARNGNVRLIEFLLRNRANPLVKNRVGDTPLMLATYTGKLDAVRLLVAGGSQLNHSGWTPLHYAVFANQPEVAAYLIEKGADLNVRAPNQQTPLMIAARNANLDIAKLLLQAGADVTLIEQHGETAAGLARKAGNSVIAALIEAAEQKLKDDKAAQPAPAVAVPAEPVPQAGPEGKADDRAS